MTFFKNWMVGLVLFAMAVGLLTNFYKDMEVTYDLERTDYAFGNNPMEQLENLDIISGINGTAGSLNTLFFGNGNTTGVDGELVPPSASLADIFGALKGVGIGIVQTFWGIISFPYQIMNVVLPIFKIPTIVIRGLQVILYVLIFMATLYLFTDKEN